MKTNKKIFNVSFSLLLVLSLAISLCACNKKYTVTVHINNVVTTIETDKDGNYSINESDCVKDGYTFMYFINDSDNSQITTFNTKSDISITAIFLKNIRATVSAQEGGSANVDPSSLLEGSSVTYTAQANEGYTFSGWYKDDTCVSQEISYTLTLEDDYSLVAHFDLIVYSISYDNVTDNPTSYTIKDEINLNSAEAPVGKFFKGWAKEDGTIINGISAGSTGNLVLKAAFDWAEYTITYENLIDATTTNPTTYTYNDSFDLTDPSEMEGYTFSGWADSDGNEIKSILLNSTGDITIKAYWVFTDNVTVVSSGSNYGAYYESALIDSESWDCGITYANYWGYTTSSAGSELDIDGYTGITAPKVSGQFNSQNVNVLTVSQSNDVVIVPWAKNTGGSWSFNTVRNNIKDFENRNPGYKVIAAVNGSAFDINGKMDFQYQPSGVLVSNGEVYKSTLNGREVLGFSTSGLGSTSMLMSQNSSFNVSSDYTLDILDSHNNVIKTFRIPSWNTAASAGSSTFWYGLYNSDHKYQSVKVPNNSEGMMTIVVKPNDDDAILPNYDNDFYGRGTVTSVNTTTGSGSIKLTMNDSFVIQTYDKDIQAAISEGTRVRVQREITGDYSDYNALGTFGNLLVNGNLDISGTPEGRNPRTMIGYKEDGTIVLIITDGRQGAKTIDSEKGYTGLYGTDPYETAAILKAYGCVGGYNLDGGGSTTMVIRDETSTSGFRVVNYPSDGSERNDSTCVIIAVKNPTMTFETTELTQTTATIHQNTIDLNGVSYSHLYAKVVGQDSYEEFDANGNVTFTGLESGTAYNYSLYIDDGSGGYRRLWYTESFTTLKAVPIVYKLTLSETDTSYVYKLEVDDPNGAINIAKINIGTKYGYMKNNTISVKKSLFTLEQAKAATVEVTYLLGTSETSVTTTYTVTNTEN